MGISSGIYYILYYPLYLFGLQELMGSVNDRFICINSTSMDLKVLWAPFIDNFKIPYLTNFFGHRKAWLLIIQSFLGLSILLLGYSNPSNYLEFTAICSLMVAFFQHLRI